MAPHCLEIVSAVRKVIGDGPRELQRPHVEGEFNLARFYLPQFVTVFEAQLRDYTGAKHAVATSSGTAALHLALVAAGVGHGDEVICPSLTFAATANAIVHAGATPHFVDVNHQTLAIHPFKLRQYLSDADLFGHGNSGLTNAKTGRKVKAIMPVHLLGIPCAIDEIDLTAAYYGLTVIEDAAEALGSWLTTRKAHCGTVGTAGVLSFNLNKIVTTGGGGAVLTNDENIASAVRHLGHEAKVRHPFLYEHDAIGYNYEMPPINAALGVGQMEVIEKTLKAKAHMAYRYGAEFAEVKSAEMIGSLGNNWLNCCLLDPRLVIKGKETAARDAVLTALLAEGYQARALFTPLHLLNHFKDNPRQQSLETSEDLWRRAICLPSTLG